MIWKIFNPLYIIYFIIFCLILWLIYLATKNPSQKFKKNKDIKKSYKGSNYTFESPPSYGEVFGVSDERIAYSRIHEIINKFSPIYIFHPDERYYPAPLDTFSKCTGIFNNSSSTSIDNKQIENTYQLLLMGENTFDKRFKIVNNRLIATKNDNYFISIIQNPNVNINDKIESNK